MTEPSMVERVARAIFDADREFRGVDAVSDEDWRTYWSAGGPTALPSAIALRARAAVAAMREPTEAVRQALRANVPVDGHEWEYVLPETLSNGMVLDAEADCWRALIAAALGEG